ADRPSATICPASGGRRDGLLGVAGQGLAVRPHIPEGDCRARGSNPYYSSFSRDASRLVLELLGAVTVFGRVQLMSGSSASSRRRAARSSAHSTAQARRAVMVASSSP